MDLPMLDSLPDASFFDSDLDAPLPLDAATSPPDDCVPFETDDDADRVAAAFLPPDPFDNSLPLLDAKTADMLLDPLDAPPPHHLTAPVAVPLAAAALAATAHAAPLDVDTDPGSPLQENRPANTAHVAVGAPWSHVHHHAAPMHLHHAHHALSGGVADGSGASAAVVAADAAAADDDDAMAALQAKGRFARSKPVPAVPRNVHSLRVAAPLQQTHPLQRQLAHLQPLQHSLQAAHSHAPALSHVTTQSQAQQQQAQQQQQQRTPQQQHQQQQTQQQQHQQHQQQQHEEEEQQQHESEKQQHQQQQQQASQVSSTPTSNGTPKRDADPRGRDKLAQRKQRNKESARRYREKQVARRRHLELYTKSLTEQNRELESLHDRLLSLTCEHRIAVTPHATAIAPPHAVPVGVSLPLDLQHQHQHQQQEQQHQHQQHQHQQQLRQRHQRQPQQKQKQQQQLQQQQGNVAVATMMHSVGAAISTSLNGRGQRLKSVTPLRDGSSSSTL